MKMNELQGRDIVDVRAMTPSEVTKSGLASGIMLRMSDGRRFFCTGLVSEDHGALTDQPALPV